MFAAIRRASVFGEQLSSRSPAGLLLIIEICQPDLPLGDAQQPTAPLPSQLRGCGTASPLRSDFLSGALGFRRRVSLDGRRRVRLNQRSVGEYTADLTESESRSLSRR
jgi:hypothetical protein